MAAGVFFFGRELGRGFAGRGVEKERVVAKAAAAGRSGEDARHSGAEASIVVAQAGITAIGAALEASELLFDVGGGSITDRSLGFDRHWRNARTAANHNPRAWKAAVAGAYHLTGEEPPTTGLF